mmetsp:Transcript_17164/g.55762  ORF Transcript_17164/g.55762 Transcript_17164/m.55762 type:complete len:294 (-) Transcript_17164:405-1286(-)
MDDVSRMEMVKARAYLAGEVENRRPLEEGPPVPRLALSLSLEPRREIPLKVDAFEDDPEVVGLDGRADKRDDVRMRLQTIVHGDFAQERSDVRRRMFDLSESQRLDHDAPPIELPRRDDHAVFPSNFLLFRQFRRLQLRKRALRRPLHRRRPDASHRRDFPRASRGRSFSPAAAAAFAARAIPREAPLPLGPPPLVADAAPDLLEFDSSTVLLDLGILFVDGFKERRRRDGVFVPLRCVVLVFRHQAMIVFDERAHVQVGAGGGPRSVANRRIGTNEFNGPTQVERDGLRLGT